MDGFIIFDIPRGLNNDLRYVLLTQLSNLCTHRSMAIEGKLKIVDEDRFEKALFHGIGPAKAFGCGLMLVKRI